MEKSDVQTAFMAAGFSRLVPHLDLLARSSIRLSATPVDESSLAMGASKLGGLPDLPPGTRWPEWRGTPQSFVMQLRLSDLWSAGQPAALEALPRQGMLWFFYDARQETYGENPTDTGGWRVLFQEGDCANLQRVPTPMTLPPESRFQACALRCASELTITQRPSLEIPGLKWTPADQEGYDRLLWSLRDQGDRGLPQHRFGGFPDTIQDDMRAQCRLVTQGAIHLDDSRSDEVLSGAMDWHLLVQVDSDAQAGMRWANTGMLYYWIRQADLHAQRFDAAWLVLQSE